MAKLSKEEQTLLDRLKAKMEAPDPGPISRAVNVTIDLGKPDQVKLAQRFGFLDPDDDEPEDDGTEEEADDTPKRKGYFGD